MKYATTLFIITLAFSRIAFADESSKIEATKLIEAMNMQASYDQVIATGLDDLIKLKPTMAPYKNVMLTFFAKYASYNALKPKIIELYASEFSTTELKEMNAFYSTATGKKAIDKLPILSAKGADLGREVVLEHMDELQQMIKDETARIQKSTDMPSSPINPAADAIK